MVGLSGLILSMELIQDSGSSSKINWKPIPQRVNYEASDTGLIRSVGMTARGRYGSMRQLKDKILKPKVAWNGRLVLNLRRVEGLPAYPLVHRLVAQTWIPNPDNLPEINHIDGNPQNNHISNLEWCTHQQNHQHRVRTLGIDNLTSRTKLTPAQKVQIMASTGSNSQIAKRFGVSASRVSQIKNGL
jgi:hypothetical protein